MGNGDSRIPTETGIKNVLAAIRVTCTNIYGDYELLPITEFIANNVPYRARVQRRVETTLDIIGAINYIREHELSEVGK